ncbi:MAG: hypothetical protein IKH26_07690 [Bacteroidaceae bacterium]|nr:hypothetical protein [Bacteroidaceae bacterium]
MLSAPTDFIWNPSEVRFLTGSGQKYEIRQKNVGFLCRKWSKMRDSAKEYWISLPKVVKNARFGKRILDFFAESGQKIEIRQKNLWNLREKS